MKKTTLLSCSVALISVSCLMGLTTPMNSLNKNTQNSLMIKNLQSPPSPSQSGMLIKFSRNHS